MTNKREEYKKSCDNILLARKNDEKIRKGVIFNKDMTKEEITTLIYSCKIKNRR